MSLGHDVSVPKVGGKICRAIENALEEALAITMDERHGTDALEPLGPIEIVDKEEKFIRI